MQDDFLLLIGIFIVLALLVIFSIIIYFKRKKSKLIKNVPDEDFKVINYDSLALKKKEALAELSRNAKEVNDNGKLTNEEEKGISTHANRIRSDSSLQGEDTGIGTETSDNGGREIVEGRDFLQERDADNRGQDSFGFRKQRRRKHSWR